MRTENKKACSFFGNRDVKDFDGSLLNRLTALIESLARKGCTDFLLGGYGAFDALSLKAVSIVKQKYPHIKAVRVLACYKQNDKEELSNRYDQTVCPEAEYKPKKLAIFHRNQKMIDQSFFCIFYVLRRYGGAFDALTYAMRKNKDLINLAE